MKSPGRNGDRDSWMRRSPGLMGSGKTSKEFSFHPGVVIFRNADLKAADERIRNDELCLSAPD